MPRLSWKPRISNKARLQVTSYARPGKLFTASGDFVERAVGVLQPESVREVIAGVVAILRGSETTEWAGRVVFPGRVVRDSYTAEASREALVRRFSQPGLGTLVQNYKPAKWKCWSGLRTTNVSTRATNGHGRSRL